jgi:hypothetical protein
MILFWGEWLLHNLLANYEWILHNSSNWSRWFWLYHSRHFFPFHFAFLYRRVVLFIGKRSGFFEGWQESKRLYPSGDFNLDEPVYIRNLAPKNLYVVLWVRVI